MFLRLKNRWYLGTVGIQALRIGEVPQCSSVWKLDNISEGVRGLKQVGYNQG